MSARRGLHQGWWRLVESYLIMALGGTLIGIVWSGHFLRYVRPEMTIPLVVTGACLIGLALWTIVVTCRRRAAATQTSDQPVGDPAHDHAGAHDHGSHGDHGHGDHGHGGHGPVWSVWLIVVPVLIAALLSPPAIGAQLAQRRGPAQVSTAEAPPLPDVPVTAGSTGEALGLPMGKYVALAMSADEQELTGRRFTVTGFVINRPEGDGWYLARIRIRCCAADGVPLLIRILDAPPQADDGWVEVTGSYLPPERESYGPVARLKFESVLPIEEPDNPYVFG